MAIKQNCVAYGVKVKLNDQFEEKCIGDQFLKLETVLWIDSHKVFNNQKGEYVTIRGGSLVSSGYAYLNELDLEFEIPDTPLYRL